MWASYRKRGRRAATGLSEEIIVVVPHSTYAATYCRSRDSSCLILTQVSSPDKDDPRSTQTAAQFLGLAWQAANDKARELGWIR